MDNIFASGAKLTSFSNNTISVLGKITLELNISSIVSAQHEFIVTDMLDVDFLIGLDFLEEYELTVNFGKSKLSTRDGQHCTLFDKPRDTPKVKKIRCKDTVTIQPRTVQFISGKIPRTTVNYQGITEPYQNTMLATGILMAPSIIYTDKSWVPVRCVNVSDEPMTLYRGSKLGFLRPATENGCAQNVKLIGDRDSEISTDQRPASVPSVTAGKESSRWTKRELFDALKLDDIQVNMSEDERIRLENVLWQYRACFAYDKDDFGCCNMFQAHIQLKRDFVPSWTPERKVPYNLEHKMDSLMDNMIDTGVVEPLTTESSWNSPIFLVAKSTPGTYRVVADLRGVNKQCIEDKYDLPNINHLLDRIGGDCIFSTFDMAASFHQVPYDVESKPITAFSYKGRRYNFARMIMGHCSSSSIFTRMVYRLLEHFPSIEHLMYFLDDLLLGSRDVESHIDRLEMMLKQLESANLKLTPSKTELMRTEVRYVGITLSPEGIRINDDRIEAIKKLQPPRSVKETQKVLGFLGYNRKFVKGYSELSKPLYALLQKGKRFDFTPECMKSFESLKTAISNSPTLCFPNVHDPLDSYEVKIDASNHGLGSTLSQMIDGERRIVGYFSKAVPRHKREWGQTKLEFESLCASLKHWSVYLRGARSFRVVTDCKSLLNLDTIFKTSPTMIRRFQELANFNFTIEHISGINNDVADFLSRYGMKSSMVERSTQTEEVQGNDQTPQGVVNSITPICVDTAQHARDECVAISSPICDDISTQLNCKGEAESSPISDDKVAIDKVETPSVLQSLFESEHDSSVTHIEVSETEEEACHCSIPEMPVETSEVIDSESEKMRVSAVSETPEVIPNIKKICEAQDSDQILKVVKDWIRKGEKPRIQSNRTPSELISLWKQFSLLKISEDGLLMRKWVNKKNPAEGRDLIVIPESMIENIMRVHHSNLRSCHPGVNLSMDLCRRSFYWPNMLTDFKEYIAACEKCSAVKQPQRYLRAPLQHMLFHNFNDCIIVDHIVPEMEGRTPRGYRYILTICDAWSNYIVAVPVRSQTAKENIEQIVRRWQLVYGTPREIIVDNHKGFSANFFHAVWEYFDCKVTHGTSYKSRSTGKVERSNKRINQALRAAIPEGKERSWDLYLGYCVMALNSLKNRHTGYSSNRLVFGRENNTPITLLVDNDLKTEIPSKKSKGAYELYKTMKRTLRKVRENADTDFLYAKHQHDRNLLGPFFKEGDLCYILINCPQHKYSIRWRGPLLVKRVVNDHLYVVQITPEKEKIVNISKMKHFIRNKHNIKKYPLPSSSTPSGTQDITSGTPSSTQNIPPGVSNSSSSGPPLARKANQSPTLHQDSDDSDDEEFVTIHHPQHKEKLLTQLNVNHQPTTVVPDQSTPIGSTPDHPAVLKGEQLPITPITASTTPLTTNNNTDGAENGESPKSADHTGRESTSLFLSFDTSDEDPEPSNVQGQGEHNTEPRRGLRNRETLRPPDRYGEAVSPTRAARNQSNTNARTRRNVSKIRNLMVIPESPFETKQETQPNRGTLRPPDRDGEAASPTRINSIRNNAASSRNARALQKVCQVNQIVKRIRENLRRY